jgi:hypothetical protein
LIIQACAITSGLSTCLVPEVLNDITHSQKKALLREAVPVLLVLQCWRVVVLHGYDQWVLTSLSKVHQLALMLQAAMLQA